MRILFPKSQSRNGLRKQSKQMSEYYQALPSSVAIHKDHFVRVLVEELAAHGPSPAY